MFLEGNDPFEFHVALYTLGYTDIYDARDYILKNYQNMDESKLMSSLLFLEETNLEIDSSIITNLLNNHKSTDFFAVIASCTNIIKFENEVDIRAFIKVCTNILAQLKARKFRYNYIGFGLSEYSEVSRIYILLQYLVTQLDDLYELVLPYFADYGSRDGYVDLPITTNPYILEICIKNYSGKTREASFKTLSQHYEILTESNYLELVKHFKSKKADVRNNLCVLLQKTNAEVVLSCADQLLTSKNEMMRQGGVSILTDNFQRVKNLSKFKELQPILTNLKISEEFLNQVDALLLDKKPAEIQENQLFDVKYQFQAPKFEANTAILDDFMQITFGELQELSDTLYQVFEKHIGEEVEVTRNGSTEIKKIGFDINKIFDINTDAEVIYKKFLYYEEYLEFVDVISRKNLAYYSYILYYYNIYNYQPHVRLGEIEATTNKMPSSSGSKKSDNFFSVIISLV